MRGYITLVCLPVVVAYAVSPRSRTIISQPSRRGDVVSDPSPILSRLTPQVEAILSDLNAKVLLPLQEFSSSKTAWEATQRQERCSHASQQALGLAILSPIRIVRLSVVAWVLAELLDYFGVLENPHSSRERIVNAFKQHANVSNLQSKSQLWWEKARKENGIFCRSTWSHPARLRRIVASWQSKHQFAVGAAVGLLFSQFVWSLAGKSLKLGTLVYILAEINDFVKRKSGKSVVEQVDSEYTTRVQDALDAVQSVVRHAMNDPSLIMKDFSDRIDSIVSKEVLPPQGAMVGLLAGIIGGVVVV